MSKNIPLLQGQKFGRLTVVSLHHISHKPKSREYYLCKCDCGKEIIAEKWNLKTKHTNSCGCFAKEVRAKNHLKHGKGGTRIHKIWRGMKTRCYNKNSNAYYRYGKRGIKICDEWKDDFMSFYNWAISNGYKQGLTIDRINNDGNYEPLNCRWATIKEQCANRSSTKILLYKGEKHSAYEWAKKLKINYNTLIHRLERGWKIEKALEYK